MKHERTNKFYSYHEKHGAWVIHRDIASVHTTGGSWFESKHFQSEQELLNYLDEEANKKEKELEEFKLKYPSLF